MVEEDRLIRRSAAFKALSNELVAEDRLKLLLLDDLMEVILPDDAEGFLSTRLTTAN